jgi:outer membrane protein assembly factor BamB
LNKSPTAPPSFSGARGFLALDDTRFVAYDLTDGSEQWTAVHAIDLQPATSDQLVFFFDGATVVALSQTDGSVAWRREFSEMPATPLVFDNGWLVAATNDGAIVAFRASDGVPIWRRALGVRAAARPALAADRVYVPAAGGLIIALRVEDGETVWQRRIGGTPTDMLALDDRLYVGSDDNYLYCLKTDAGVIDWRWQTGADVVGRPAADERLVYFVSLDNMLRGLNRRTGNQIWKRVLPLRPKAGPVSQDDTLIVSGVAPTLRLYARKDGTPAGDVATDGELAAPPYVLPAAEAPTLIVVTRHLEKGAILSAFSRASEPAQPPPAAPVPVEPPAR